MSRSRFRTYLWVFAKLVLFQSWRDRGGYNSVDAQQYAELPGSIQSKPNDYWRTIPYVLALRLRSFVFSHAFFVGVTVLLLFLACVEVRFVAPGHLPTAEHRRQAEILTRRIDQLGAKRADHGMAVIHSIFGVGRGDSVQLAVKAYNEKAAEHLVQERERLQRELRQLPQQKLEALRISPRTARTQGWLSDRCYQIGLEEQLLEIAEAALPYTDIVDIRKSHQRYIDTLRESEQELLAELPRNSTAVTPQMLVDALDEDPLSLTTSERHVLWNHLTSQQESDWSVVNAIRRFRLYRLSLPSIELSNAFFTPTVALFVLAILIRIGTDERPNRVMERIRRWRQRRRTRRPRVWATRNPLLQ